MLLVVLLVPFVLLAACIAANPAIIRNYPTGVSLPITKRVDANGILSIVQRDQARVANFATQFDASNSDTAPSVPLDYYGVAYVANIGVGDPPTSYQLLIDTGSSNTWVGASKRYVMTKSSVKTSNHVKVKYGSGFFKGTERFDTVTIAPGVVIYQQSIGVASNSSGLSPFDGILGIGPTDLTFGTLYPDNTSVIPTVTDNLFKQGRITRDFIAVSFEPTNSASTVTNGELTFGSIDPTKFTGNLTFFPVTKTPRSSLYWGVDASFRYGDDIFMKSARSGIIDTGTTMILLGPEAFSLYIMATGAIYDNSTGFYTITTEKYNNLKSLFFEINGSTFEVTRNAQIFPHAMSDQIRPGIILLTVGKLGYVRGMDFICGMAFLERFYSVFDSAHQEIGFAATPFTYADIN